MTGTPLRPLGACCLTALLLAAVGAADAAKKAGHSFQFTIASDLDMDVQGKTQKLKADTDLRYNWEQGRGERTLRMESMRVKLSVDGKEAMNTFMSRAKVVNVIGGATEEVPFKDAPDELKETLKDSFDTPLLKLGVDENGGVVKRTVLAGPGAKALQDNGVMANALLFHPPFFRDRDEWQAEVEVPMGNGGFARGKLTYKKVAGGKGGQAVRVTGTLGNKGFQPPGSPLTVRSAKYVVRGEQTYDPALREWSSGRLKMDVSFEMAAGEKQVGSAKGVMDMTFARAAGKE